MSRDVITVGSTMRILLLYRGEYSQWSERFMNYLEEQTDVEEMINSIKNGEHPLPVVAQVSLAGTAPNASLTLKDPKFWTAEEKKTRKIDRLARSLFDSNDTAKREKVAVQSESEGSDDEDISDLKKITALLAKAFNQKKYYVKPTNNNLRTSSANKKPEYVKSEEKKEDKKADEKKQDMSKVKCYNCKKEGHFAKDCKKAKVKDYKCYKTKMLLAKKDSDEQVLLVKDQAWMESSIDSDQEISANMVFMAKMEKVLSDSEEKYYDNFTNYGLFLNNDDDQEIFHDAIESASENFNENHIVSQKDHDESEVDHNDSEENDHLVDKLIKNFKIEKFKRARENKIDFAYDYEILNESYVNEKINFADDYFQEIINLDFEKIDSPFQQTSSLKPYVPTVILEKIIIDLEDEVVSLLEKEKENLEIIESLK
ncbi:retrovirus-related pol polyprotein from transposon TNT 1-94 [Tanacetum coccineum]|uniref:Retrovirus-related pol polyprotein from transposon TNT 1-94 n=1 Tax=Tanacetum coccineum TaxID=301880 RepID=A0ABQ5ER04_9ASTR